LASLLGSDPLIEVVASVGTGPAAVTETTRLQPDVVIMDVTMPELNGIEATRQLQRLRPSTRVVMLSMHSSSEHVHRAMSAGASGYLLKDAAGDELIVAVRTVHAGRRYLSRALPPFGTAADANSASPLDSLSVRERQVLQLVVEGRSSAEIAAQVHLSPKSVDTYRSRLMKKLGVADITGLVKFAIQHGITPAG
jgi:DNA-binding NarL/FixJ family response regulator